MKILQLISHFFRISSTSILLFSILSIFFHLDIKMNSNLLITLQIASFVYLFKIFIVDGGQNLLKHNKINISVKTFNNKQYLQKLFINLLDFLQRFIIYLPLLITGIAAFLVLKSPATNSFFIIKGMFFANLVLIVFQLQTSKKSTTSLHKLIEISMFSLVILIFTIIKAPYFNKNFTGNNTMKYNTYVEPAKYMVENNNFFRFQRKYTSNPINNVDGLYKEFSTFPLLEWSLAISYKILGLNNIFFNTRLVMYLIGLLILLSSYFLVKKQINQNTAIIFLTLLSTNPLFLLATHLTIYDTLLMLFFVNSYSLYCDYKNKQKLNYLAWAGLLLGIASTMKSSVIFWSVPVFLLDNFLINFKSFRKFVQEIGLFFVFILLPSSIQSLAISNLPNKPVISSLLLIIGLILVKYVLTKKTLLFEIIGKTFDWFIKHGILAIFSIVVIGSTAIYLLVQKIGQWSEFFTDSKLIFLAPMYQYIFQARQLSFVSYFIFALSILGFILLFHKSADRNQRITMFGLLFGAAVYLVINSKVIFFHNYYSLHIIYVYLLLAAFFLNKITKNLNIAVKFVFIILLAIFCFKLTERKTIELLAAEKWGFQATSDYIATNTQDNEIFVDDSHTLSITISASRPSIAHFNYPEIQKDIKEIGFNQTMKKYHIKYLISSNEKPSYLNYAIAFTNLDMKAFNHGEMTRRDMILQKFGLYKKQMTKEEQETSRLLLEQAEQIEKKQLFKLEKVFDSYKIYNLYGE